MQLSYKFRAYPDGETEKKLFHSLDLCRWLYNTLLGILNDHRGEYGKEDTQAAIAQIKQVYPELNDVHSKTLHMVNYRLWGAIKGLSKQKKNGRKIGKLKYKKKGSNNRRKAGKLVALVHEKVRNIRNNRNHQLSRKYVAAYDVMVVEDNDILGMVSRQHRIAKLSPRARRTLRRNILDAGWGDLVQKLSYKATAAGKLLLKVCPRNTTQRCSHCGSLVYKDITKRTHECPYCGLIMDRDENSAVNIRIDGITMIWAGNRPEPDGEARLCSNSHKRNPEIPGKQAPMKQEATAFRPR